ncbi:host specificity factor TipJ family phage tail protein [Labrys neptuniae]|uniref:Host specificity factor TipJ family phage tail protein n=1 Tax=Labrys neptuniae TaxID=376174 RepID=A0ABV3PGF1_9HYPH
MTLPVILPAQPLEGEILSAEDSVTVIVAPNPLRQERHILQLPAGSSVTEILRLVETSIEKASRIRASWHVSIEGEPVPAEWHGRVRVKPGKIVVLRARATGGGNLLKSLLMLVVAVITAFIAPYLAPIFGTFGASLITAAITIGASLLINALFPVSLKDEKGNQVYSISGNQNLAAKYEPVPIILGRMRVFPRYGASAYTEFEGNDQVLRLLYVWGYGPLDITDLKIADTPLAGYKGVEIEHGYGYPGDGQPTIYPGEVIQQNFSIDVKKIDGWIVRTTSEDITEWAIDIVAPAGLNRSDNSKGKVQAASFAVQIQYSEAYAENWIALPNLVVSGRTSDPVRKTVRQTVPLGQYDIRIQRLTPDDNGAVKVHTSSSWTALRSYRPGAPLQFPFPVAWTALKIRATAQLNGVVDNFNGVVTSRVKAWDGASWTPDTPSQNPADLLPFVLQCNANARPLANSRIDWPTFQAWHAYNVAQGWKFNAPFDQSGKSVYETAKSIASAGRAAVVFRDGLWSVVWDDPDAPITQHYTPRNSSGFQGKRDYRRLPHGLRVQFKNEGRRWQDDEILVFRDGYNKTNATLFEQFPLVGITDHTLAWRMGRYHLAQLELRPETYTLNVDIESFINTRGDRVRVSYDAPMFGISAGRVKAVEANLVTLDEEMLLEAGKNYAVRFRTADGGSLYRTVAPAIGPTYTLTLSGTGAMPAVGDLAMFGEAGIETVVLRVFEIRPGDDMTAEIDFVDDAPAILQADQGEIPPFDSQITDPPDPATLQPLNLSLIEGYADASQNYAPTATLMWQTNPGNAAVSFEIIGTPPGDVANTLTATADGASRSITWQNLDSGTWIFEVRAIFGDGSTSQWSSLTQNVMGASQPPPDISDFAVNVLDTSATFSWAPSQSPVAYAEIRYSPALVDANWAAATVLVQRTNGLSATVPYASGSYLIKWVTYNGVYSTNAALIVAEGAAITALNVVEEIFDMSPFTGTMTGVVEDNGVLRLAVATPGIEGRYELPQTLDLGAVYTSRVSGEVVAAGVNLNSDFFGSADFFGPPDFFGVTTDDWRVLFYYRATSDDPSAGNWGPWTPFVIGDYTFRAVQFALGLSTEVEGITAAVSLAHISVDMPDRDEVGRDVPVPTSGLRVNFTPPYRVLKGIAVTGQGMATGDYLDISNKAESGFDVVIRNASGNPVARTIDYIAKGYGKAS